MVLYNSTSKWETSNSYDSVTSWQKGAVFWASGPENCINHSQAGLAATLYVTLACLLSRKRPTLLFNLDFNCIFTLPEIFKREECISNFFFKKFYGFNIVSELYSHHNCLILEHFLNPDKTPITVPVIIITSSFFPSADNIISKITLSASTNLPILDTEYM